MRTHINTLNAHNGGPSTPPALVDLPARAKFRIEVRDFSLAGAGIVSGDRVVCERVDVVTRGTLAAVATPYGLLLRFVYVERHYTQLEAGDSKFPSLCLSHAEARVVGRPVKLVRRFPQLERGAQG